MVLTGGVNRGAYQAGVICGLAAREGLRDGQSLAYDVICGTSIGALNAYLTAAAQYTRLAQVWEDVASRPIFSLKSPYDKITRTSSGVLSRVSAAVRLALGSTKDVKGVVDSRHVVQLIHDYCNPTDPVAIPLCFGVTNLTKHRTELFLRKATTPIGLERQAYFDSKPPGSKQRPLREATDDILRSALFASAALPIVFEPVLIPRASGIGFDQYIDGGITDNVPIDVAQHVGAYVDIVAVDPDTDADVDYPIGNALDVLLGVFGIMQDRTTLLATRLAYSEGLAIRPGVSPAAYNYEGYELTISRIRPAEALPGKLGDFADLASLKGMFRIGQADGMNGWKQLAPDDIFR